MKDKYIGYRTIKVGLYIMFNETNNDYSEKQYWFRPCIIECLREAVRTFVEKNLLSEDTKNNIYNYLYQAREVYDEKREERIKLVNEIIKIMNQSTIDNSISYYKYELYKRQDNKKCLSYSEEKVESEISNIKKSICNDLLVFAAQNEFDTTDEEFEEYELQNLIDDSLYYNSLNAFLHEKPQLFTDSTFYNRTVSVLKLNEEKYNNHNVKKLNKRFIKDIKKRTKNID